METTPVTVKHSGEAVLRCVLLLIGTCSATLTKHSVTPMTAPLSPPLPNSATVLTHQPKQPPTGSYDIRDSSQSECLKAQMGVQYIVTKNKNFLYLNIDPSSTSATGKCGQNATTLSLNFTGGHLEFTFHKEETVSYVTAVRASLEASICKSCQREIFRGVITNKKLFKASAGLCYKCDSETILQLTENLHIKIINAKMQAFDINDRKFGLEEECWPDFNKWAIPIILGGVASGICLIAILTYLIIRENRPQGYERI